MEAREKNEAMTAEAMRAKEEYLFNMGKLTEREICDLEGPNLFTDQYGEQYIQFGSRYDRVKKPEPEKIVKAQAFETFSLDGLIDYITHRGTFPGHGRAPYCAGKESDRGGSNRAAARLLERAGACGLL